MGRNVKRVPLDFDHPIGEVWSGYLTAEPTEPPQGEGYQLWETLTEGSPVSPVFATPQDLAAWMSQNDCTVTGPVPFGTAMRFIDAGWAPTIVKVIEDGTIADGAIWTGTTPDGA